MTTSEQGMILPTLSGLYLRPLIVLLTIATESFKVLFDFQFPPMNSLFLAKKYLRILFWIILIQNQYKQVRHIGTLNILQLLSIKIYIVIMYSQTVFKEINTNRLKGSPQDVQKDFKTTIRSKNSTSKQEKAKQMRVEYEDKIQQLQTKVVNLEQDIEYYDGQHRRQLQNLQTILQCSYNKKMLYVKNELRVKYDKVQAQNEKLSQELKEKQSQVQLLRQKCERSEAYCKHLESQLSNIRHQFVNQSQEQINKLLYSHEQQLIRLQATHKFQRDFEKQIHCQAIQIIQKQLQVTKAKMSQVLIESQNYIQKNQKLTTEKEDIIKEKHDTVNKLNAKMEGLASFSEHQISSYFRESQQIRKDKLSSIEELVSLSYSHHNQPQPANIPRPKIKNIEVLVSQIETSRIKQPQDSPRFGIEDEI